MLRKRSRARHGLGDSARQAAQRLVAISLSRRKLKNNNQTSNLIVKKYYDIGIAVATDEGLVVPVLRDADKLSSAEIEQGIAELATKSRDKKITLQELQGGTFSITNGGVFGSLMSTPLFAK